MTLIALSLNHGQPILIGDILMTTTDDTDVKEPRTPTFIDGTGDLLKNAERHLHSFKQKIYVIAPNLCIGMAGGWNKMVSLLREIRQEFKDKVPNELNVREFVEFFPVGASDNLGYILLLATMESGKVNFHHFEMGNYSYCDHPLFERMFATGSGRRSFLKVRTNDHFNPR
jgi:hypothetical protein